MLMGKYKDTDHVLKARVTQTKKKHVKVTKCLENFKNSF